MSFDFHSDRNKYFEIQKTNTSKYIIPFIEKVHPIKAGMKVLEVGCRDGGVLFPFLVKGCTITGVDLDAKILEQANERYSREITQKKAKFIFTDIHDYSPEERYDIIILKDVIEHVYDQLKMVDKLRNLLIDNGIIFFGYPPWQNPFGGHQQVINHKVLSKLPYIHLLPNFIYLGMVKRFAKGNNLGFLKATKDTRISIERFRKIMHRAGLQILGEQLYLINPIYESKFGLKPRKQSKLISAIPYLRNFVTTTCDCIVGK